MTSLLDDETGAIERQAEVEADEDSWMPGPDAMRWSPLGPDTGTRASITCAPRHPGSQLPAAPRERVSLADAQPYGVPKPHRNIGFGWARHLLSTRIRALADEWTA
jgi:hypothetical protein